MAHSVELARQLLLLAGTAKRTCIIVRWYSPSIGMLKLNTDESMLRGSTHALEGGLLRGDQGRWRGGFVANIGTCYILFTEVWCIWQGLIYAGGMGVRKIQVESDYLAAVEMIHGSFTMNALCRPMVLSIQELWSCGPGLTLVRSDTY
ncbi:hypothetical protein OROMI_016106 [Orobanche minor]